MSNTITIELCKEDRKRIDELVCLAGLIAGALDKTPAEVTQAPLFVVEPEKTQEEPEQPAQVNEHPVDEVSPHELPEPAAEPDQPKYTKADILAKVQKLAGPNNPKREDAKAIVKSYGTKVSDIPEDKYAEVMERLTALEG